MFTLIEFPTEDIGLEESKGAEAAECSVPRDEKTHISPPHLTPLKHPRGASPVS